MYAQKILGHGSRESVNAHKLRVSWALILGSYEGNFGPQPINIFSVDGKST